MGGCRCTYRNCTVKSDGKTHMFHYPVFEKVRCHQWLINAHRLDFLNLKVSQLKNRVVCQHHFKDDNFMNFKKDKLTFEAIPTEDGPYCDSSNYVDLNPDSSKLFSIIIDDIENDYITGNDKKANYSIKYGDFLTNLDLMDLEKISEDSITYKNLNNSVDILPPHKEKGKGSLLSDDGFFLFNISLPQKNDNKFLTHPTLVVPPYTGGTDVTLNDIQKYEQSVGKRGLNTLTDTKSVPNIANDIKKGSNISTDSKRSILVTNIEPKQKPPGPQKKESKVKIISENKVTNLVPIIGEFKPVSPNFVLNVPNLKRKVSETMHSSTSKLIEDKKNCKQANKEDNTIEIEIAPLFKDEDKSKVQQYSSPINLYENNFVSEKSPKTSILKPKVPQERIEAINKKRMFNMKLRDMVELCLDKLDNCYKPTEPSSPLENTKSKLNTRNVPCMKSLPKTTPNISEEYTIAFLEARLTKLENKLLDKIEQNSNEIVDLKNKFAKIPGKTFQPQTKVDEEIHKKQLFHEIAKYLSPSSKSLIYEELFINKFAHNEPITSPKYKRRRYK